MDNTAIDILESGLTALHIPADQTYKHALIQYCELIETANTFHSFVAASGNELIIKHILDSLAPFNIFQRLIRENNYKTIADFGSGAGLPGLPLALTFPEIHFTLIDRMTKRITFLESAVSQLNIHNITIVETQAEHCKQQFDIITFRAFRPFEYKLFKKLFRLCTKNGIVASYKGKPDKAEAELETISGLIDSYTIVPVFVPFLDEARCLALVKPKLS